MQTLHLDLKQVDGNYVELRYFIDNPNQYEKRSLPLTDIADLIQLAERDYYVSAFPEDYKVTGRRLYNWLDGSDRALQALLDKYRGEGIVLAISTPVETRNFASLHHLPWEVLHDGNSFLVQRVPAIVPVRWVSDSAVKKLTIEGEPENRALQVVFMATSPVDVQPVLDFEGEEARILEATKRQPLALTVEESGCLSELGYLVDGYGKDYFDVLHLTGHATLQDGQPRFVTETATGEAFYASAEDIAQDCLGMLKANRGEIEDAIALYQQSLAIAEQIGDVQTKAATLHEMGRLKANTGEIEEAIALYQQSLAIAEQIGDVQTKANTLWWLGHIAEQQGNYNKALDYLQPALEILQRIQSPDAEAVRQMVARVQDLIRNS